MLELEVLGLLPQTICDPGQPATPYTEDFESLTLGNLNGQNGWVKSACSIGTGVINVTNVSPLAGLQSAVMTGSPASNTTPVYERLLPVPIPHPLSQPYTLTWMVSNKTGSGRNVRIGMLNGATTVPTLITDPALAWGVFQIGLPSYVYAMDSMGATLVGGLAANKTYSVTVTNTGVWTLTFNGTVQYTGLINTANQKADRIVLSASIATPPTSDIAYWDSIALS